MYSSLFKYIERFIAEKVSKGVAKANF